MAEVANPHKQFQFSIELVGLNPFLAQQVTLPRHEIDVAEHGDRNYIVKTGGIIKFGNLVVKKISSASLADTGSSDWIWDWVQRIQDAFSGGGDVPESYKVNCNVIQYNTDGVTVIGKWEMEGVWPSLINGLELDRVSSDNTIEEIEFQVDRSQKVV